MKLTLRIWRQTTASDLGSYETHVLEHVSSDLSLLEALDQLNEQLIFKTKAGNDPSVLSMIVGKGFVGVAVFS